MSACARSPFYFLWQTGIIVVVSFLGFTATAQTTNGLSEAEIKGRELAQKILEQKPTTNAEQTGVLIIRGDNGKTKELHIEIGIKIGKTNWQCIYRKTLTNDTNNFEGITIQHVDDRPNRYLYFRTAFYGKPPVGSTFGSNVKITDSLFDSDFWLCDLGLEFLHWPEQKVLKHEFRRTRGCEVLQSINSMPSPGEYSRVVSWIDDETLGIVHAEAYDAKGQLLKVFDPKEFKKVDGQWMLQEMEIRNVQTGSRTRMEFDLPEK